MNQSPLHAILQEAGCVFQERHGWERPGWFSASGPSPVGDYDWYGVYGTPLNQDQSYCDRLKQDYTFDFPSNYSEVSIWFIYLDSTWSFSLVLDRSGKNAKRPVREWPSSTCPTAAISTWLATMHRRLLIGSSPTICGGPAERRVTPACWIQEPESKLILLLTSWMNPLGRLGNLLSALVQVETFCLEFLSFFF